ncbi:MAG TPA: TetR family transcriptional regulator [Baekduia sp.]|nr:TetR family transcriptional regulator [Baekduia sp.]
MPPGSPPAVPRRLAPEARRRHILDAARAVFAERPYATVTTADVAAAAGVARSLVHHYFGGIREVFLAVVADGAAALSEVRTAGPETPLDERLAGNIAATLDVVAENRATWLAVSRSGAGADPEIRALTDAAVERSVTRALAVNGDLLDDTPAARLALRCFHAFSTEATAAWLAATAAREDVERLLLSALRDLVTRTIPALAGEERA